MPVDSRSKLRVLSRFLDERESKIDKKRKKKAMINYQCIRFRHFQISEYSSC